MESITFPLRSWDPEELSRETSLLKFCSLGQTIVPLALASNLYYQKSVLKLFCDLEECKSLWKDLSHELLWLEPLYHTWKDRTLGLAGGLVGGIWQFYTVNHAFCSD